MHEFIKSMDGHGLLLNVANRAKRKMKFRAYFCLLALIFYSAYCAAQSTRPISTQPSAATMPTSQPSVSPPPIAPGQVASQSESTLITLRNMEADLLAEPMVQSIDDDLPSMTAEIAARSEDSDKILASHTSVQNLRTLQAQWEATHATLSDWRTQLDTRSKLFSRQIGRLTPMESDWQQTLNWAAQVHASPEISQGANAALQNIQRTRKELKSRQSQIWALERHVDAQDARVVEILASIVQAHDQAFSRLLMRDSSPLWSAFSESAAPATAAAAQQGQNVFVRQFSALRAYIQRHSERVAIHALVLFIFAAAVTWIRRKLRAHATEDPESARAMAVFERPIATATVLSFVASIWIYPDAPQLLWAIIGAAGLVPTVLILRKLIDRRLFGILNVLVLLFFFDQIRSVLASQPLIYRLLFLAETAGVTVYLVFFLRIFLRSSDPKNKPGKRWIAGRLIVRAAIALFAFAFSASVFGYCGLADLLGDATLASAYLALIFYASTRIATGLLVFAMRAWPLNRIHLVRRHESLLITRIGLIFGWMAAALWFYETLDLFSIRATVTEWGHNILFYTLTVGSISISLKNVLAFILTIWAAFLLSRFIRFVLQEDIFERLNLPTGLPYAITRMLHYVILVWGFCIAVAALGYDMTKFTILAGAFGVGLGFGMQNIVNNFVSGVILLFERPIKVGDVIQMADTTGIVQHIGIRASIMRTPEGSEIIVPNGSLLSDRVTNWTLSNGQRAVVLPISIAPGPDPNRVIEILKAAAKANPQVLATPAPEAYVTKFTADAFSFELRAWANQTEGWLKIRSELAVAIYNAALKEGLTLK